VCAPAPHAICGLEYFTLLDQSIESLSLNPDAVVDTWLMLAK